MQALIRKLSRENPLWSAERIRDTLVLLGYPPICDDTVRPHNSLGYKPPAPEAIQPCPPGSVTPRLPDMAEVNESMRL